MALGIGDVFPSIPDFYTLRTLLYGGVPATLEFISSRFVMRLSDFTYTLPERLIAKHPASERSASRMLTLKREDGRVSHHRFVELLEFLQPEDVLVFNNTRVIPARLYGRKESGGRVEILIERELGGGQLLAQIRASKSLNPGSRIALTVTREDKILVQGSNLKVERREGEFFVLAADSDYHLQDLLDRFGHMPLPPYIKRKDEIQDRERYQTVYARVPGAVAAPTAGLHFDESLLLAASEKGVGQAFITLHIGAGTFQPVRVEDITEHKMHSELVEINSSACERINTARNRGGRVIAVGTTSVRSLEAAAKVGGLEPFSGETDIFIYPGYKFKLVDAMITNFHLPESTLLMLVSAFCSQKKLLDAYQEAIREEYRFFSYGDAMFIY